MDKKIKELKDQFRNAKTETELSAIDREMNLLSESNPIEFSEKMLKSIQDTNKGLEEILLKEKLEDVLPILSVSHLAKEYFHKTPQWFYQRLNGNVVNGKPANFTKDELNTLANALTDISNKIKQSVAFVI